MELQRSVEEKPRPQAARRRPSPKGNILKIFSYI